MNLEIILIAVACLNLVVSFLLTRKISDLRQEVIEAVNVSLSSRKQEEQPDIHGMLNRRLFEIQSNRFSRNYSEKSNRKAG